VLCDDDVRAASFTITTTSIAVASDGVPYHVTGPFPNTNNPNTVCKQSNAKTFANRGGLNVAAATHTGVA
jgi:hypothetical protein